MPPNQKEFDADVFHYAERRKPVAYAQTKIDLRFRMYFYPATILYACTKVGLWFRIGGWGM